MTTVQVAITLYGFLGSAFAAENFPSVLMDWLAGLGVTLSDEEYDKFNRLVFHSLGCTPANGTDVKLTVDKI